MLSSAAMRASDRSARAGRRARARPKPWSAGRSAAPRASFEELEIRTRDGVALRAVVLDPPEGTELVGTAVLAHAMFARKSSFGRRDRPGIASALANAGFRTIAFDFRGHGDSVLPAPLADWGYDDLVRLDMPAVVECARARAEGRPVIVVGHSLGGHVALAAEGTGRIRADGIVGVAANVWLRELERSRALWALKAAVARGSLSIVEAMGAVPARRLRIGSDDASPRYFADLFGGVTKGAWRSADGVDDYLASLSRVTIPVANVLGEHDRLMCRPESGEAFVRRCAGPVAVFRAPGSHMELVTKGTGREAILRALAWIVARVG